MFLQIKGRCFAGAEEVRNVLHLYEGHGGSLEFDAGRRDSQIDESGSKVVRYLCVALDDSCIYSLAKSHAVFQGHKKVPWRQTLSQYTLDPSPCLVRRGWCVLVEAHLAQVSVQRHDE